METVKKFVNIHTLTLTYLRTVCQVCTGNYLTYEELKPESLDSL